MNFALKDQFRLHLFIYCKVIQFSLIKGHDFDKLFRNYSQTEVEEQRSLTINGTNYLNACQHSCCYYGNDECLRRNKYTLMHGHRKAKLI